jgi:hypothetical protein
MAKCAESPAEYGFSASRPPFFPAEIEFSLYFSLLLVETTSHETASTTTNLKEIKELGEVPETASFPRLFGHTSGHTNHLC